jgi:hypothetical protein
MVAAALPALLAAVQPTAAPEPAAGPAIGTEIFISTDSEDTDVARIALDFDLRRRDEDDHLGVRLEQAWYRPAGGEEESRQRVFLRAADTIGDWQWRARIGTDGDTVIGALSVNDNARIRKELFVERDLVETRQGLDRGIYSTFVGAAADLPADDRNVFGALVGVQDFTGDNVRLHLRGSYIHLVKPDWGLSLQLRGRYFSNSAPREFDYYSPRWYAELLPVVQLRRFVRGWELVGAAGYGAQRGSDSDWRESRFLHARFRSPQRSRWAVHGAFTYTNQPSVTGTSDSGYSYVQFTFGLSRRF